MIGRYIGNAIPVLDHGSVELVDFMGSDLAILQAARISTGAMASKGEKQDRELMRYLVRARHTSPLEMCEIKLHIKLPIFVARQWIRHRTASVNEVSARYTELPSTFYVPEVGQICLQSTDNRQGRGEPVTEQEARDFQIGCNRANDMAFDDYGMDIENGISRELARINLPLSTYTEWFWKTDLHNLLHFLKLRMDRHAQWEIRQFADVIADLVKVWCPLAWEAFEDYQLYACTFSKQEMDALRIILASHCDLGMFEEDARWATDGEGMTDREVNEFIAKIVPENGS